jgi:putative endonuclease
MSLYFIYALRSKKNNKRYIGYTSKDVQHRLSEHNAGSNSWTRQNRPFRLVYAQIFSDINDAKEMEKFLKSGQGRQCLDELGI